MLLWALPLIKAAGLYTASPHSLIEAHSVLSVSIPNAKTKMQGFSVTGTSRYFS
jgi:hypothetical protein